MYGLFGCCSPCSFETRLVLFAREEGRQHAWSGGYHVILTAASTDTNAVAPGFPPLPSLGSEMIIALAHLAGQ